jgi:hypothetical protein
MTKLYVCSLSEVSSEEPLFSDQEAFQSMDDAIDWFNYILETKEIRRMRFDSTDDVCEGLFLKQFHGFSEQDGEVLVTVKEVLLA